MLVFEAPELTLTLTLELGLWAERRHQIRGRLQHGISWTWTSSRLAADALSRHRLMWALLLHCDASRSAVCRHNTMNQTRVYLSALESSVHQYIHVHVLWCIGSKYPCNDRTASSPGFRNLPHAPCKRSETMQRSKPPHP